MKKKKINISVEKKYDGSYEVSSLYNGHLVHERYYGYSKAEAVQRFKARLSRVS